MKRLVCWLFGHNITASSAVSFHVLNYEIMTWSNCKRCGATEKMAHRSHRYAAVDFDVFRMMVRRHERASLGVGK